MGRNSISLITLISEIVKEILNRAYKIQWAFLFNQKLQLSSLYYVPFLLCQRNVKIYILPLYHFNIHSNDII